MKKIFQKPTVRAIAMAEGQSILAGSDTDTGTGGDANATGRAKGAGFNPGRFEDIDFAKVTPLKG